MVIAVATFCIYLIAIKCTDADGKNPLIIESSHFPDEEKLSNNCSINAGAYEAASLVNYFYSYAFISEQKKMVHLI